MERWTQRARPSPLGWSVAASAAMLIIAGVIRADDAMVGLGFLCLILFFSACAFGRAHLRRLQCECFLPRYVDVGRPFRLGLRMRNEAALLDAWCLRVGLRVDEVILAESFLFRLPAGGITAMEYESTLRHRGPVRSMELWMESDAPFGMMRSAAYCGQASELLARPEPLWPWSHRDHGERGAHHGEHAQNNRWRPEGEPRGIRPWHPGDKPRSVVWPASLRSIAQGNLWMVRDTDPPGHGPSDCTIVFHSYGGGGNLIRPDRFEEALRHIAGAVRVLVGEGRKVLLLADFDEWTPREYRSLGCIGRCLDLLALADRHSGTEAHDLARVIREIPTHSDLIVLSDFPVSGWLDAIPPDRKTSIWTRPERKPRAMRKAVAR